MTKLWKDKTDEEILVDTKKVLDSYREVTKKSLLPGDVFIDGKWVTVHKDEEALHNYAAEGEIDI